MDGKIPLLMAIWAVTACRNALAQIYAFTYICGGAKKLHYGTTSTKRRHIISGVVKSGAFRKSELDANAITIPASRLVTESNHANGNTWQSIIALLSLISCRRNSHPIRWDWLFNFINSCWVKASSKISCANCRRSLTFTQTDLSNHKHAWLEPV